MENKKYEKHIKQTNLNDKRIYDFFKNLDLGYNEDSKFYLNLDDINVPIPENLLKNFIIECQEYIEQARDILKKAKLIKK